MPIGPPSQVPLPKSACRPAPRPMLVIQAAERGWTGSRETGACQTLSAGNSWQPEANRLGSERWAEASVDGRYRILAEQLPGVLLAAFDHELRFQLVTGAAAHARAPGAEELVGRTVLEVFPPELAGPLADGCRAALAGERRSLELPGWRDPASVCAVEVVPLRPRRRGRRRPGLLPCCDRAP